MSDVYIKCQVLRGIFDTEWMVLVNGSSSYFISRDNVKVHKEPEGTNSVNGKVRGYLILKKKDKALVQLPGEAVVGGLRTWVDAAAIVNA